MASSWIWPTSKARSQPSRPRSSATRLKSSSSRSSTTETGSATSSSPSADARSCASLRKLASQYLVDLSRIRLAAGRFHRLTHKEVQGLLLAGAKLRHLTGVGGDDALHQPLDFSAVGDLAQTAALDDRIGFE